MKLNISLALKYTSCVLLIFNFFYNKAPAQDSILFKGVILNSINSQPIPYVNILNKGTSNGFVTNEEGEFQLNIIFKKGDSLLFSCIGYNSVILSINIIKEQRIHSVSLSPATYSISEIVIRPNINPIEIVKKAIENVKLNYNTSPFIIDGYYREYIKENKEYGRLIESEISVYNKGYTEQPHFNIKTHENEDFKILAFRKSNDFIKCFPEFKNLNHLKSLFAENPILYYDAPINTKNINNFSFKIDSLAYYENELYYVISFYSEKTKGLLAINSIDYSVLSLDVSNNITSSIPLPNDDTCVITPRTFSIKFRKYEGKLYVNYMRYEWGVGFNQKSGINCKIDFYSEFMTNNIVSKNVVPFPKELLVNKKKDLYIQYNSINPEYFDSGNILFPTDLQKTIEKDIKKRMN